MAAELCGDNDSHKVEVYLVTVIFMDIARCIRLATKFLHNFKFNFIKV